MAVETVAQIYEWMAECVGERVDNANAMTHMGAHWQQQIEFKCVLTTRLCNGVWMCVYVCVCVCVC